MREAKRYGERSRLLSSAEAKKKYFLAFEGVKTELLYFNAVHDMHIEIGISPLIEIIPLERDEAEESWSNPQKIIGLIAADLNADSNNKKTWVSSYNAEIDTICFIFDRDPQSFKSDQYDAVLKQCTQLNIRPFVSNPCFEFWLLLHFDVVYNFDRAQLLENKKVSNNRNFIMAELSHLLKGYSKNKFDTNLLMCNIHTAIENEKQFCEDLPRLKTKLGSNVGLLLSELLEK